MRRPQSARPVPSPAWSRLLLTGTLLASCIRSASLELTEGTSPHLPVPRKLDGILSASWFRGQEAQQEAAVFSPQGLPGPSHSGQEGQAAQGSLIIRNLTTRDSGSSTAVLGTRRGRRSVTEQVHAKANPQPQLWAFPEIIEGVIQSELNYSVVLQCLALMTPKPVLSWTLGGQPRGTGERLIVRRLSRADLGTYVCVANSNQGAYPSQPVRVALSEVTVDPTDMDPIDPDPVLTVSGGSAIALLLAGSVGLVILVGGVASAVTQAQRTDRRRVQICC